MGECGGEILFVRVPPAGLLCMPGGRLGGRLASVFGANGAFGSLGGRGVTCFWIGLGRRVRAPGPRLMERLCGGAIVDVLDVGCAGALDPSLRKGDLVLGSDDLPFDTRKPLDLRRRPEARAIAQAVAQGRGRRLQVAPILTHERAVLSRQDRLGLFEETGCAAVQMEHAWFLGLLESLVPAAVFRRLCITHLVLITDAVPEGGRHGGRARSAWQALQGYSLPGRGGIVSLRREFLRRWLVG